MDIRKIENGLKAVSEKIKTPGKEAACPFSEVFNSVVGSKTEINSCTGISEPQTLIPIGSIQDPKLCGIAKTEEILKLLDNYSTALGDQSKSLREISPMLDSLTEKVNHAAKSLPQDDALHKILDQARIIATVERMKFDRGDYI